MFNRGDDPMIINYSKRSKISKLTVTVETIVPRGAATSDKFIIIIAVPHKCWSKLDLILFCNILQVTVFIFFQKLVLCLQSTLTLSQLHCPKIISSSFMISISNKFCSTSVTEKETHSDHYGWPSVIAS